MSCLSIDEIKYLRDNPEYLRDWCLNFPVALQIELTYEVALEQANELAQKTQSNVEELEKEKQRNADL